MYVVQGSTLMGVNKKPVNEAARHANMLKAITHLRGVPQMSRRCAHNAQCVYVSTIVRYIVITHVPAD